MSSNDCFLGDVRCGWPAYLVSESFVRFEEKIETEEIEKERAKQRLRQQLFTLDNSRCSLLENSSWTQCISIQCRLQFYFILLSWLRLPFIAPSQDSSFGFLWTLFGGSAFPKKKSWCWGYCGYFWGFIWGLFGGVIWPFNYAGAQFTIWQGPTCIVCLQIPFVFLFVGLCHIVDHGVLFLYLHHLFSAYLINQ